ncbi:MAG: hypothetical protein SFV55_27195 [Haliscomenobacter sp.]|uniref:toxin-antitoxin system YwqK family antitoxin n=1 Tax=Haliscomenobacter sp. TaxID=2717303 RepID=UPI0029A261F9|nr:hypothetical protein [Haliscomenobacter sp.]MDX2072151.1 hypothetical protein [Haliscomenobacter sp.]
MEIVVKIIILFFLLGSITQRIEAQGKFTISSAVITPEGDTVNRINHNGEKEGRWLVYKEGRKTEESFYLKGQKHGKSLRFAKSGMLLEESNYANGLLTGKKIEYWPGRNKIYLSTEYKDGNKEGWEVMYYENGKISIEEFYVNNIPDGPINSYFKNGQIKVKAQMKDGEESGTWYIYLKFFGKKKEFDFDENGKKIEERRYFLGMRIKTKTFF